MRYPIPLDKQDLTHVVTELAAYYLSRSEQTLRIWARTGKGPLKAVKISNAYLWSVADIRNLLKGE